jgi:hypothetical protein
MMTVGDNVTADSGNSGTVQYRVSADKMLWQNISSKLGLLIEKKRISSQGLMFQVQTRYKYVPLLSSIIFASTGYDNKERPLFGQTEKTVGMGWVLGRYNFWFSGLASTRQFFLDSSSSNLKHLKRQFETLSTGTVIRIRCNCAV